MQKSLIKFAPQAMVLAVAIYWSWPALQSAFPQVPNAACKVEPKKPTGQDFAAAVLSPKFLPFPKRNPFLSADYKPKKAAAMARAGKAGKKQDLALEMENVIEPGDTIVVPESFW